MKILLLCLMILFTGCAHMTPVEQRCQVQLEAEVIEYILGLDDLTDQNKLQSIMLKEFMRRAKTAGIPLSDDPCTVLLIWRSGNDNK